MYYKYFILVIPVLILFNSCNKHESSVNSDNTETRNFRLGFTPFPYDVTSAAVEYSYNKIKDEADIISHHFDDGVPWQEAYDGTEFHPNIISDWQYRLAQTPVSHKIFLSVTPINFERNGLAAYKGESTNMSLFPPWDTISFNDPLVKTAYTNYCLRIAEFFNPDYFCIGIEVNLLMDSDPVIWDQYFELHSYVYDQLKSEYPDMKIFVTLTGMDLVDGYTYADHDNQIRAFNEIINYSDMYALSLHTFLSVFLADTIPADMFDKIFSISDKPICIAETSYPAEIFSIFSETIVFNGSESKQTDFFSLLFSASEKYKAEFIINFVIRDYDNLWKAIGSPDDITKVWKDTGFFDENGNEREVITLWRDYLSKNPLN
ncbi:MAG: hypothetical protein Kow0098_20610 [Ignavibacteriaceae bacterium]